MVDVDRQFVFGAEEETMVVRLALLENSDVKRRTGAYCLSPPAASRSEPFHRTSRRLARLQLIHG